MYDLSGKLTMILTTLVVANLGKDWQQVNKQHRSLLGKDVTSGS